MFNLKQEIVTLSRQVYQLFLQGEYEKAVDLGEYTYVLAQQHLAAHDPRLYTISQNLALVYEKLGRYKEAEPLFLEALEIARIRTGEKSPQFASVLHNLGGVYKTLSRYAEAKAMYLQVIEIDRAAGEHTSDFATSLSGLAELYRATKDFEQAELLMRQALDIRRRLFSNHPTDIVYIAISLDNLADLYRQMGRYDEATSLFEEALSIFQRTRGEEHPDYAIALNNLALLHQATGNFLDAEKLMRRSLEIKQRRLGESSPEYANSLMNLGHLCSRMGRLSEAAKHYSKALAIVGQQLGESHPTYTTKLNDLANLYIKIGHYEEASRYAWDALRIASQQAEQDPTLIAAALYNLGMLHERIGNYTRASEELRSAKQFLEQAKATDDLFFTTVINHLAIAEQKLHHFEAAESLYQQALDVTRSLVGDQHPEYATTLANLASLYREIDRFDEIEELLNQALTIYRAAPDTYRPQMASALEALGELYHTLGRYTEAEPYYRESLELVQQWLGKQHPDMRRNLYNLAELLVASGRPTEALSLLLQAERIHDRLIGQIFAMSSEEQRMIYLSRVQADLNVFLSLVLRLIEGDPAVARAGMDLVLRRKGIGAEALAMQRDAVLGGRYPHLRPQLDNLIALRRQISQKMLAGPEEETQVAYSANLAWLEARFDRLEAELVRQIPEIRLEQQLITVTRQRIADALPEGSALIELVRFDPFDFHALRRRPDQTWLTARYLALVLLASEPDNVQIIDLGDAGSIELLIPRFQATITASVRQVKLRQDTSRKRSSTHTGTALRLAIFEPLVPALGGRKRLFLASDGDLSHIPFEVLPAGDGRYLIDDYQISYLSAGRDVLRFAIASALPSTPPLIVADPDFDLGVPPSSIGEKVFKPLSGTRLEGEQIAALLSVKPLLGEQAIKKHFTDSKSPRIVHIASHGYFLPDMQKDLDKQLDTVVSAGSDEGRLTRMGRLYNPFLRSAIALAGANTWLQAEETLLAADIDNGLLTAEDVTGLDLLSTEMVVLSACETGLGRVRVGEGVFGLRRAFVLAGAKTLVMSLWKVPDKQTCLLMELFYENLLKKGLGRAEALRQAQLALRQQYPTQPFYWGAFICQGDPRPLHGVGRDGIGVPSESGIA